MLRVKKVIYLHEYSLQIHFSNRKVKIVDFKKIIFEEGFYLKPLRDIEFFKQVSLDADGYTICWPNGADFSPDSLYEWGKEAPLRQSRRSGQYRSRKKPCNQ